MDTDAMIESCEAILNEMAKMIALLKAERELREAEGKVDPEPKPKTKR